MSAQPAYVPQREFPPATFENVVGALVNGLHGAPLSDGKTTFSVSTVHTEDQAPVTSLPMLLLRPQCS